MSFFRLLLSELRHRPLTAVVSALIIGVATGGVAFFVGLSDLAGTRTRIIQRDLGLNVLVLPAETDLDRFWLKGYSEGSIDAGLIEKLEQQDVANRLVPMLQRTVPWGDGEAILTGVGEEQFQRGNKKKPVFGNQVKEADQLVLGSTAAAKRKLSEGDTVELMGRSFEIDKILSETGSRDDIRIYSDLVTVQELLDMQGRINEIRALECHCDESIEDPEAYLKETLEELLPGTTVIRQDREADTRRQQRILADRIGAYASPVLTLLSVAGIFGLAILNSNQRRREIGLLSALGKSSLTIGLLVWMRSAILGLIGGLLGAVAGWVLIAQFGDQLIGPGPGKFEMVFNQFLIGGLLGGGIASVGALLPALTAAQTDPATTLRDAR